MRHNVYFYNRRTLDLTVTQTQTQASAHILASYPIKDTIIYLPGDHIIPGLAQDILDEILIKFGAEGYWQLPQPYQAFTASLTKLLNHYKKYYDNEVPVEPEPKASP